MFQTQVVSIRATANRQQQVRSADLWSAGRAVQMRNGLLTLLGETDAFRIQAEVDAFALQDFLDVYDELGTNVDTYADRGDDLRKALKPVIEADTEFGSKLRAFKSSLGGTPESAKDFTFLLGSALEAIDAGMKDHRDLLAEQEETFKHKKKDKKRGSESE